MLAYPVRTRRRLNVSAPSDQAGERLLQTFTVSLFPEDLDAYLAALTETYDPAVTEAGMRLETRWCSSAQLGELVTVQSTWSMANDDAFHDVRSVLLRDERWWRYCEISEALVQTGWRHLGYAEQRS